MSNCRLSTLQTGLYKLIKIQKRLEEPPLLPSSQEYSLEDVQHAQYHKYILYLLSDVVLLNKLCVATASTAVVGYDGNNKWNQNNRLTLLECLALGNHR